MDAHLLWLVEIRKLFSVNSINQSISLWQTLTVHQCKTEVPVIFICLVQSASIVTYVAPECALPATTLSTRHTEVPLRAYGERKIYASSAYRRESSRLEHRRSQTVLF